MLAIFKKQLSNLFYDWNAVPRSGWVMHICVSKVTIIDLDNGLSPGWRQAIIWTNAGILLIGPFGTNFSENWIEIIIIEENAFKNVVCKMVVISPWPQYDEFQSDAFLELTLNQCLYSLCGKTSYRQYLWNLEAARLDVIMIVSLWDLTGISAALLLRCLSNFRMIGKV